MRSSVTKRHTTLPARPQTAHQEFSSLKQSNSEANQREEVLKKLASAHDSYVEISSNLREGTKVALATLVGVGRKRRCRRFKHC